MGEITRAINEGNFIQALSICDEKLRTEPNGLTEVQKIKGELLCKLGRLDEAECYYSSLLESRSIPWARLALGKVYFQKKNYAEAEVQFESLINESPAYVHALDWLAETMEIQEQLQRSQDILERAVDLSPKSPVRQRKLGVIAFRNGAYKTAGDAYGNAILTGRNSCFGSLSDFTGLTKSLARQNKVKEALEAIDEIRQNFKSNPEAHLYTALSKSILYRETDNLPECEKNLDIVFKDLEKHTGTLHPEIALEIMQTCLKLDNHEMANKIVKQLVNDYSEDEKLHEQVRQLCAEAGKFDEANEIIQGARREIIKINNEGVKMVQEGKFEQSINFFIQAAKGMPNNATINFNAAYSMIRQMKKTGEMSKYFLLCRRFMEQGHKADPGNQKYYQLLKLTEELSNETV